MSRWVDHKTALAWSLVLSALVQTPLIAQEPSSASFDSILNHHSLQTTLAVRDYITSHPDASDYEAACQWLLEDVRTHGWEQHAAAVAESILDQPSLPPSLRKAALEVSCVATAKAGQIEQAVDEFKQLLKSIRLKEPEPTIALAQSIAAQAQLAGKSELATEVFEALSTAYFLNAFVRNYSSRQIDKYSFFGKTPTPLTGSDTHGKPIDLSQHVGKVVLIDFWATNCPPCLKELPRLKRIYAKHHDKGFEIIGVSLDEEPSVVNRFQKQMKLPWSTIMNQSLKPAAKEQFKVKTIPSLFLVNRQGRIAAIDVRGVDLEPAIERLMKQPPLKALKGVTQ